MKGTLLTLLVLFSSFPSWAGDTAADATAALFRAHCAACHGDDATGSKTAKVMGANLHSAEVQAFTDQQLYDAIATSAHHKQYLHGFVARGILTPDDVKALVQHIRELGRHK